MIRRHTPAAIFMHWFNAVCWIILLFTGFGLLVNPAMQPVGMWWHSFWAGLFGARGLLFFHVWLGLLWLGVYVGYACFCWRSGVAPFLREVFAFSPAADLTWCARKGLRLVIGPKGMVRMGMTPDLPPQGFYNAGQKFAAVIAVASGLGLALTGLFLAAMAFKLVPLGAESLAQWALFLHFVCAGCMGIVLPIHIYMAALAPGEGPALKSMLMGWIPVSFIKHHNPLWYRTLVDEGRIKPETSTE